MPYSMRAECPCCHLVVDGDLRQIEEEFGLREVAKGQVIPQSYCLACRSARCRKGEPCKVVRAL